MTTTSHDALDREIDEELTGLQGDELDSAADAGGDPISPQSELQADKYGWALVKRRKDIASIDERCDARITELKAQIAAIEGWRDRRQGPVLRSIAWLERSLELFARSRALRLPPKAPKAYKFPGGTLNLRAKPGSVDVRDPEAFIAWAMINGAGTAGAVETDPAYGLLEFPPPPAPKPVKKAIASKLTKATSGTAIGDVVEYDFLIDGELVPGIAWVEAPEDAFAITLEDLTAESSSDDE